MTVSITTDANYIGGTDVFSVNAASRSYTIRAVLDCNKYARAQSDYLELFTLPAGHILTRCSIYLKTAEGAPLSVNLGTYSGAAATATQISSGTDIHSAFNANGTANAYTLATGATVGATAGVIDRIVAAYFGNAAATAVLDVIAEVVDVRYNLLNTYLASGTNFPIQ